MVYTNGIHKIIRRNYHLVYYVTKVSDIYVARDTAYLKICYVRPPCILDIIFLIQSTVYTLTIDVKDIEGWFTQTKCPILYERYSISDWMIHISRL